MKVTKENIIDAARTMAAFLDHNYFHVGHLRRKEFEELKEMFPTSTVIENPLDANGVAFDHLEVRFWLRPIMVQGIAYRKWEEGLRAAGVAAISMFEIQASTFSRLCSDDGMELRDGRKIVPGEITYAKEE